MYIYICIFKKSDIWIDLPRWFNLRPNFTEVLHGDASAPREALEAPALPLRSLARAGGLWPVRAAPTEPQLPQKPSKTPRCLIAVNDNY